MLDPLGKQPKPKTGRRRPDPNDQNALRRVREADIKVGKIWVDHPPQRAILAQIRRYMEVCQAHKGLPLTGRRLSQMSQAGKSATVERLRYELAEEDRAANRPVNRFRVLHVTMDRRMTLKMLYQQILIQMDDAFADEEGFRPQSTFHRGGEKRARKDNIMELEHRIGRWVKLLGVECIVIDEVQHLHRGGADASEVTKKLQAFLDRSVVPLVFIGDETSSDFFLRNPQFAARLLRPLELHPLNDNNRNDRKLFKEFCTSLDQQIQAAGLTTFSSGFDDDDVLEGLITASGGHVGRVARLVQVALPAALERGALSIEPFDLSNAVRDYAMILGWVHHDPFSEPV